MMKIGFLDRSDASWTAGASYSRSMVHALASAMDGRCELNVLSGPNGALAGLPAGVRGIQQQARLTPEIIRDAVREHALDVLLPITEILLPETPCALIGWVPDFQHRHLAGYFTGEQCRQRDLHFDYLVGNCDAMMFSSASVLADFRAFYPAFEGPSAAVHFPSSFAYEPALFADDPTPVLGKYALPRAFALVANQFWKHKNHRLVLEAVARARRAQPGVHVVMVGMLSDSRDVANPHLSEMIRRLSTERLFENVSILGEVSFADLVALLRCAIEVIQPSEFEGWNTTVEDALALGKRVACSDIPTHREQASEAFFFPADDATPLAAHLQQLDWSLGGWAGEAAEIASLQAERARGRVWASGLIDLCERAVTRYKNGGRTRANWVDQIDELRANPLTYIKYLESENARLGRVTDRTQGNFEKNSAQLQKARERVAELEEKLRAARAEAQSAEKKYWREKSKPLRTRLHEEWLRLSGRRPSGNP